MDYIKDFCEHVDCPEHPDCYSEPDAWRSYKTRLSNFGSNTIEKLVSNTAKVVISIHGMNIPFACTICSNRKSVNMKKLIKREVAKKELTK